MQVRKKVSLTNKAKPGENQEGGDMES